MKNVAYLCTLLIFCVSCQYNAALEKISAGNSETSSKSVESIRSAFENRDLVQLSRLNFHGEKAETFYLGLSSSKLRVPDVFQPIKNSKGKYDPTAKFSWKAEDGKMRSFLNELTESNVQNSCMKQLCAMQMILKTELLEDNSAEALEALRYYTDVLATEKNLSPAIYYYSLQKLKALGKSEKLAKTVRLSLNAVDEAIRQNRENTEKMEAAVKAYPEVKKSSFYVDQVRASKEFDAQYKHCAKEIKRML
ncbi:hypothetical protein GVN20_18380 [Runella sp. CRIBMP]|uniref:hypothetical protein n=1 Tax=Runella sp. CRIBMP TaxID=2683261 RepID=UPI0014125083|nr:hypothetical protein [Runella sp. CRIBMP]NBB21339.1 hypothetical protein [Runella sp. CRIBMP]